MENNTALKPGSGGFEILDLTKRAVAYNATALCYLIIPY